MPLRTKSAADGATVGDVEFGDADGDGDLDLTLADWGPGDPDEERGRTAALWLQRRQRAVLRRHRRGASPTGRCASARELELVDVDNDFDLDLLVSTKSSRSSCSENDGTGPFKDAARGDCRSTRTTTTSSRWTSTVTAWLERRHDERR